MTPRRPALFLVALSWMLVACLGGGSRASSDSRPVDLTVFAAASLIEPFREMGRAFEAEHPGLRVVFNFGGSQQLAQQLAQGAGADLFASADRAQMEVVAQAGRVRSPDVRLFAHNRLVVVMPAANPGQIAALPDLARPGLRLVLADAQVPAGHYSRIFLDRADSTPGFPRDFGSLVLANTVSLERNVKGVLSKVQLGEADAGIVYTSDVAGLTDQTVRTLSIPASLNVLADYGLAVLVDAAQPGPAADFTDFVLSPRGQEILEQAGFVTVQEADHGQSP